MALDASVAADPVSVARSVMIQVAEESMLLLSPSCSFTGPRCEFTATTNSNQKGGGLSGGTEKVS